MAEKLLTPVKTPVNEITKFAPEAATSADDGMVFELPKVTEEYLVVVLQNTNASTAYDVTLKAPTKGSYAAASSDVKVNLAGGELALLRIESARYANTDGTVKIVPGNVAVKASVLY